MSWTEITKENLEILEILKASTLRYLVLTWLVSSLEVRYLSSPVNEL